MLILIIDFIREQLVVNTFFHHSILDVSVFADLIISSLTVYLFGERNQRFFRRIGPFNQITMRSKSSCCFRLKSKLFVGDNSFQSFRVKIHSNKFNPFFLFLAFLHVKMRIKFWKIFSEEKRKQRKVM